MEKMHCPMCSSARKGPRYTLSLLHVHDKVTHTDTFDTIMSRRNTPETQQSIETLERREFIKDEWETLSIVVEIELDYCLCLKSCELALDTVRKPGRKPLTETVDVDLY